MNAVEGATECQLVIVVLDFIALLTMEHDSCSCDVCTVFREYPYNLPYIPADLAAPANFPADAGPASISATAAASSNIIPADPALASFIPTDGTSISDDFSGHSLSTSNLSINDLSVGVSQTQTQPISAEIFLGDLGLSAQDPFLYYPDPLGYSPIVQIPQQLVDDEQISNVQIQFDRAQSYQYRCEVCRNPQQDSGKLKRHMETVHAEKKHKCRFCGQEFSRLDNRNVHEKSCWDNPSRELKKAAAGQ